jgi:aspartate aminotransferase
MAKPSASVAALGFPATVALTEAAARLAASGKRVIPLASGDPDLPTPPHIVEAAVRALRGGATHYPPIRGTGPLREAIADKLARDNGVRVSVDQIMVAPGAKSALFSAVRALVDPGDDVLILDPSWVTYTPLVELAGAHAVRVQLDANRDYPIERETLERHIGNRTKAILLNTPCNPTGRVATRDELETLGSLANDHDLWVISDEIYEHFVFDGATHCSLAADARYAPRVVVVNGFSKSYAMTGWRLGWLAGPEAVIELASRVQAQTVTSAATFTMAAGVAALTGPQDVVAQARALYRSRRDLMLETWLSTGSVRCTVSEGTFYLFPHTPASLPDVEVAATLLGEHGVACVPGSVFGNCGSGRLRIALTAPTGEIEDAAQAIAATFATMEGSRSMRSRTI